ncbi:MAG: C-terminal helicase domain-containing protein [Bacteroidota bacterium]|nr:C-terminal helicase domain-containing protein [Bacteroidota bacterium]
MSTEAGGSGLNLQVADILINFELPWNPAKKNQRIGRIDRLGQKSKKLTIFNFISRNSIEQQIASGLLVKQSLFDGVLGEEAARDMVDFSTKGRSQFIEQLEEFISGTDKEEKPGKEEIPEEVTTGEEIPDEVTQQGELDFSGEESAETSPREEGPEARPQQKRLAAKEMEEVMNHGMQFLSGMFKMSTGKELGMENQKISIDEETGEVVMRFKLPG